jgi:hypothetical protein
MKNYPCQWKETLKLLQKLNRKTSKAYKKKIHKTQAAKTLLFSKWHDNNRLIIIMKMDNNNANEKLNTQNHHKQIQRRRNKTRKKNLQMK